MNAVVADAPDHRAFLHLEHHNLGVRPLRGIFHAQFHILEELRIPQCLKIAPQSLFVVSVSLAGENARFQSVGADAPVPDEINSRDDCLGLLGRLLRRGAACRDRRKSNRRRGPRIERRRRRGRVRGWRSARMVILLCGGGRRRREQQQHCRDPGKPAQQYPKRQTDSAIRGR